MDFWDLGRLVGRRWRIAVPMLVLAIVMTALIFKQVKPDYVATAYVQLVPPTPVAVPTGQPQPTQRNPWLTQSLATLGNAALVTIEDVGYVESLKEQGYSDSFTEAMNDSSPLITLQVTGKSAQQATGTADQLVDKFDKSLTSLQAAYGVADVDMITSRRLDGGTNVAESSSNVKRAVVAVGVVGLLLAVAVTIASDAWLRRRARAKANRAEAVAASASPSPAEGSPPMVQWLVDADDTNALTMTRVFSAVNGSAANGNAAKGNGVASGNSSGSGSGVANGMGNGGRDPDGTTTDSRPAERHPVARGGASSRGPAYPTKGRDMTDYDVPADATVILPRATRVDED